MKIKWDEWRTTKDNYTVFFAKHLWDRWGVKISLHKMIGPDLEDCYHTHPAHAIRIILKGGYIEQTPDGELKWWRPYDIGWVKPEFAHRIWGFINEPLSYSLWIRFKKFAEIKLIGEGWNK